MVITIEDKDFLDELEKLHYEVGTRKDIISIMVNNNMDLTSETFKQYHNDLIYFQKLYDAKKNELTDIYIYPLREQGYECGDWELDFNSGELTVNC